VASGNRQLDLSLAERGVPFARTSTRQTVVGPSVWIVEWASIGILIAPRGSF